MALGTPGRRLPVPEDLSSFLTELLGQPIAVSKSKEIALVGSQHNFVTGRYLDNKNRLMCACVADVALAATAGAALALIPRATADEAIVAGQLDDNLRDNYHEVVNILSKFLNGPTVPHVRLAELVEGVPDDLAGLLTGTARRRDYDVTVVGYPGGHLTLLGN